MRDVSVTPAGVTAAPCWRAPCPFGNARMPRSTVCFPMPILIAFGRICARLPERPRNPEGSSPVGGPSADAPANEHRLLVSKRRFCQWAAQALQRSRIPGSKPSPMRCSPARVVPGAQSYPAGDSEEATGVTGHCRDTGRVLCWEPSGRIEVPRVRLRPVFSTLMSPSPRRQDARGAHRTVTPPKCPSAKVPDETGLEASDAAVRARVRFQRGLPQ
jgi:hypothetical protein